MLKGSRGKRVKKEEEEVIRWARSRERGLVEGGKEGEVEGGGQGMS